MNGSTQSTTVRIRRNDNNKLEELCRLTHRGKADMLAYLIEREHATEIAARRKSRKAC